MYVRVVLGPDLVKFLTQIRTQEFALLSIRIVERLQDDCHEDSHENYLDYVDEGVEVELCKSGTAATHSLIYEICFLIFNSYSCYQHNLNKSVNHYN